MEKIASHDEQFDEKKYLEVNKKIKMFFEQDFMQEPLSSVVLAFDKNDISYIQIIPTFSEKYFNGKWESDWVLQTFRDKFFSLENKTKIKKIDNLIMKLRGASLLEAESILLEIASFCYEGNFKGQLDKTKDFLKAHPHKNLS